MQNMNVSSNMQIKHYIKKIRRGIKFYISMIYNVLLFPARSVFFYKQLLDFSAEKNSYYVKYKDYDSKDVKFLIKPIAFYLPQFHPVAENDRWWGTGFTEWRNVTRAVPQFVGHYQPRLPSDLGFYDLRLKEVFQQQIQIAKNYGIEGFCYYYYWFDGRRLLEMPVDRHLADKSLDLNYCLCWANENWTRTWDGGEDEILIAQNHSAEDDIAFIHGLIEHFKDARYIRFDGRPVLLVYRPALLPDIKATVNRWREYCRSAGVGEICLLTVHSRDVIDPRQIGFDGAVEFPPGGRTSQKSIGYKIPYLNPWHRGKVFDYRTLKKRFLEKDYPGYPVYRGLMTGWDNEARRPGNGRIYVNSTPDCFGDWFDQVCQRTFAEHKEGNRYVFINAWNEWAEGTYLEPDRKYGYAYIDQIKKVLDKYNSSN